MRFPHWLRPLATRLSRVSAPRIRRRQTFRPRLEILEDRTAPAVFTVINTGDNGGVNPTPFAGTGTLRQAIIDANATPGTDTIDFALPDSLKGPNGWWTIQPLSALPEVTDPATIDGWSQAGAGSGLAPKVMLDGSSAGVANGLILDYDSTVRGLAVGNFTGGKAGIMLTPDNAPSFGGNTVQGCYVGLDPSGTTAAPNNDGVADFLVNNSSPVGNTIGGANPGEGNVMSGNDLDVDSRGYGVTIRGNIIGLNAAGTAVLFANSATVRIGFDSGDDSTSIIADNVIAGSRGDGIDVGDVNHVSIAGNKIGTDITGTQAISNAQVGIAAKGATDIIIGGTDPDSGNVIAASKRGILFGYVSGAQVQGNFIGTPASGITTPVFGNVLDGITIGGSDHILIGGSDPGAGNIIAGNGGTGISMGSAYPSNAASDDVIRGNVIRDNGSGGIVISQGDIAWPAPVGDTISENSIYGNTGLAGIDLEVDNISPGGVTLNDSVGHTGTNHFQNFPVLAGLTSTASGITVTGSLTQSVTPNTSFRIEFFANTEQGYLGPDGFYYGEGKRFLGSVDVVSDANGYAPITASLPPLLASEEFVTATATNLATGDTSEFSKAIPQTVLAMPTVAVTASATAPLLGDSVTFTATVGSSSGTPTGSVDFVDTTTGTDLGSVSLSNGMATLNISTLAVGSHTIVATYSGDGSFLASQGSTTLTVLAPASLSGLVFQDFNDDGQVDFGEQGIPGVTITLTGTDDLGQAVSRTQVTDGDGAYVFLNLRPGNYYLTETQPAGYAQGIDTVGTAGGSLSATDQFSVTLGQGINGLNYNFGEQPAAGGTVQAGQTAGIGFWNNKNGQALIKSFNGGATSTQLAAWLAATLPHIFGVDAGSNALIHTDGTYFTNSEVATRFQQDFVLKGVKLDAQVLATALSVYATNTTLDNTGVAANYGFIVSGDGLGTATVNVGSNGAAFGVANNSVLTVLNLLKATDAQAIDGLLYNGDDTLRKEANNVYSAINEGGNI